MRCSGLHGPHASLQHLPCLYPLHLKAQRHTPKLIFSFLDRLRDEYKVKSLQTFMCGGIAAKLDTPELVFSFLVSFLDRLRMCLTSWLALVQGNNPFWSNKRLEGFFDSVIELVLLL